MTPACFTSALRKPLQRFAADQHGVSAVEFGLLLPLMLALYLGGVEVSMGVGADRKTLSAAHTIADLTAQANQCVSSTTDIPNFFAVAKEVIYPFSAGNLAAIVTGVSIDTTGKATVQWSQANANATAYSKGQDVSSKIPPALRPTGQGVTASYLIWGQASYTYTPTIGYVITGDLKLNEQVYLRPRQPNASGQLDWKSTCS